MPKRKVKGGGLVSDIAHGLMKVHGKLREHKPVSKILRILPGLENVRYLGPAL